MRAGHKKKSHLFGWPFLEVEEPPLRLARGRLATSHIIPQRNKGVKNFDAYA